MALTVGDLVFVNAALISVGPAWVPPRRPLLGFVEATAALGAAPVVVAWENGERATYAALDPLTRISVVSSGRVGSVVRPVLSLENTGQRLQGELVAEWTIVPASGGESLSVALVAVPHGVAVYVSAAVEAVPSA